MTAYATIRATLRMDPTFVSIGVCEITPVKNSRSFE